MISGSVLIDVSQHSVVQEKSIVDAAVDPRVDLYNERVIVLSPVWHDNVRRVAANRYTVVEENGINGGTGDLNANAVGRGCPIIVESKP